MSEIEVILADDHPLILEGLKKILELEPDIKIVGIAKNGFELVKMAKKYKPQVILLDINMPEYDGIKACKEIMKTNPEIKIIALTVCDEEDKIMEILKAGAKGYFLKDVEPEKLIDAIRNVIKGQSFLHPQIASKILNQFTDSKEETKRSENPLTIREIEIVNLLAEGLTNKEIAGRLYISEKTVKNHITNILKKLKLRDRTQVALWAVKRKIV